MTSLCAMVDVLEPKLLILASAGSGKTYQLSNRIIGLVAKGADPEHIVALTFTRKAAAEFADTVLTKLAEAATDAEKAKDLEDKLGLENVDFVDVLNRVSRSLHRITLGTMDSFFARIVKAFQYELGLTGGRFELIEGPRQEMATDAILEHILGDVFGNTDGSEFSHAFRRASIGKEQQGVARNLRDFINRWHLHLRHHPHLEWGPDSLIARKPEDWERSKQGLIEAVMDGLDGVEFTRKGQREAVEKSLGEIRDHTLASGSLGSNASSMTGKILEAVATQDGDTLTLKFYKEFELNGACAIALRKLVTLAAQCELSAAAQRSRALHEVITAYDDQCERLLRTRGRLGFDDVKLLMGEWAHSEEARLRREAVDFRLDARIDHWLLDEFQDTSPAEWNALLPLIDEAASDDLDRSMFIVGDRKQAIYAWRGGDVTLFDQVIDRYGSTSGSKLKQAELNESWRSCPQVLELVNQVCGDRFVTEAIFGEAGRNWECPAHESASPLLADKNRGHARVEQVGDWDEKFDRMEDLLRQVGVGERELTCGILLRGNEAAEKVANELRSRGFDVILEGQREPAKDSQVGVAVSQLLKWLADPGNHLARGVIEMSPFHRLLVDRHGDEWNAIWNGLTTSLSEHGYGATIRDLIENCGVDWSPHSRRRIDDLLQALGEMDRRGNTPCREAAINIERLSIPQSPGVAAIQVMTIHKSKGLGFDLVLLPEVPDKAIPEPQRFRIMEGDGWLSEAPPQWARKLNPQLEKLETDWGLEQQHEAMCMLYVALTRAKRGLYVLLNTPSDKHDYDKPSLANWLMRSTGLDAVGADAWETGSIDWSQNVPTLSSPEPEEAIPELQAASEDRAMRVTPSSMARHEEHSVTGMNFGQEVHALLEGIVWMDEISPTLPDHEAGRAVRSLIEGEITRDYFIKGERKIRLLREQAIDAQIEGKWISGIIDRLHLHQNADGNVHKVEIIDFKTDTVDDASALKSAYQDQLDAYRLCLQKLHPNAEIDCILLSTHLGEAVQL